MHSRCMAGYQTHNAYHVVISISNVAVVCPEICREKVVRDAIRVTYVEPVPPCKCQVRAAGEPAVLWDGALVRGQSPRSKAA